jgi:hypothetical protein
MGLFFDQDWFDSRLQASGLTRGKLAQAAGMTIDEIEMAYRDQRELETHEVMAIARVLSVEPEEVADRSGASLIGAPEDRLSEAVRTAPGGFTITREVIAGIHERLDRLERLLEMIVTRLDKR